MRLMDPGLPSETMLQEMLQFWLSNDHTVQSSGFVFKTKMRIVAWSLPSGSLLKEACGVGFTKSGNVEGVASDLVLTLFYMPELRIRV